MSSHRHDLTCVVCMCDVRVCVIKIKHSFCKDKTAPSHTHTRARTCMQTTRILKKNVMMTHHWRAHYKFHTFLYLDVLHTCCHRNEDLFAICMCSLMAKLFLCHAIVQKYYWIIEIMTKISHEYGCLCCCYWCYKQPMQFISKVASVYVIREMDTDIIWKLPAFPTTCYLLERGRFSIFVRVFVSSE